MLWWGQDMDIKVFSFIRWSSKKKKKKANSVNQRERSLMFSFNFNFWRHRFNYLARLQLHFSFLHNSQNK